MRPLREKFMKSIYDYKVDDSQKNPVSLSDYKGKTLLIVNVASRCGLTPVSYTHLTLPTICSV